MATCLDILEEIEEASIKHRLMDRNTPESRLTFHCLSCLEVFVICEVLVGRELDGDTPHAVFLSNVV